jgi:hypothetical protein
MKTRWRALCCAVLLAIGIAGCSAAAGTPTPAPQPSALRQALALVPTAHGQIEFADMAAAKKRWGLSEVNSSTLPTPEKNPDLWHRWFEKSTWSAAGSNLQTYSGSMKDWGWNALDVDWEVRSYPKGPPVTVSKLRDDLDMKVVTDSLTAHKFTSSGSGDALRFDRPIDRSDGVNIFLSGVTVVPSKHLLVGTAEKSWAAPTADSSVGSNATVQALVAGLPAAVDYLSLGVGPNACISDLPRSMTPEQLAETKRRLGTLRTIGGWAAAVTDDTHAVVRTQYADPATATADLAQRQKLLQGKSLVAQAPYSGQFDATVSAESAMLRYDLTLKRGGRMVAQLVQLRDTPWAFCG